ncbi:hypothetical protein ACFLTH_11335 [Bacteroidota bacterium]
MALTDHALKTLYKVALGIAVTALIIYFAIAFFDLIVMIVISLLLALVFNPLVTSIWTIMLAIFSSFQGSAQS